MNFALMGTKATRVSMWRTTKDGEEAFSEETKDLLNLQYALAFNEKLSDQFAVLFKIKIWIDAPLPLRLKIQFESVFKTENPLTEEDKNSHFVKRNAPAIAFPFLRSYVAHIVLMAGYSPIILRPVNFTTIPEDHIGVEENGSALQ